MFRKLLRKIITLSLSSLVVLALLCNQNSFCMDKPDDEGETKSGFHVPHNGSIPFVLQNDNVRIILSFLEPFDLIRAARVSKYWNQIVVGKNNWNQIVEENKGVDVAQIVNSPSYLSASSQGALATSQSSAFSLSVSQRPLFNWPCTDVSAIYMRSYSDLPTVERGNQHLIFTYADLNHQGFENLAKAKFPNITTLILRNPFSERYGKIGSKEAKGISKANFPNLTSLNLAFNIINKGTAYLAAGNLSNLTWLDLTKNEIGNEGVEFLATGNLTNLKSLNLSGNKIKNKGAGFLATGNLSNLTSLGLSDNEIGNEGANYLFSGTFTNLTSLSLSENSISDENEEVEFRKSALSTVKLTNLKTLFLNNNGIGDQIEAFTKLTKLTWLDLMSTRITATGIKALTNFTNLKVLDLHSNNIKGKEVAYLSTCNLTKLKDLILADNMIMNEGVKALSIGNLTNLKSLNLAKNNFGVNGAIALGQGKLTNLRDLHLADNMIMDEGVKALLNGNLTNLTDLYLWNNKIENKGARYFLAGNLVNLTSLDLSDNQIGDQEKTELVKKFGDKINF